ncbi:MAG: diguanylate cyclase [Spirochaetota bacterium]
MITGRDRKLTELSKEELEKKVFDLQNLIEIAMSLSSTLDFDNLMESILYICIGQMIVDKVAIFLNSNLENEELIIYMQKGYTLDEKSTINEKSKLIKHLKSDCSILDKEKAKDLMNSDLPTKKIFESLNPEIVIPLKSKNSINGLIFIGEKLIESSYTSDEIYFLHQLSRFASIAVENSRLYRMATLDRMTGLYVHHYFQERLTEEIKRSERNNAPLTLIMADLDNFKNINDNYGHQAGDIILKNIAKIIHDNIRSFDIAARYGGEEFAIILTDTNVDAAYQIAERLRKKVENTVFPGAAIPLKVTISIGIYQFNPKEDKNKNNLIHKADLALYKAKKSGKNLVLIHDSGEE